MHKFWTITQETYLRQVKSWSFLFLLLTPFLMVGFSFLFGYIGASSSSNSNKIAIISTNHQLRQAVVAQNKDDVKRSLKTTQAAKKQLTANQISGYLTLSIQNGVIHSDFHGKDSLDTTIKAKLTNYLSNAQHQLNLQRAKLNPNQISTLETQPKFQEHINQTANTQKLAETISFWLIVVVVYMILITYSSVIAQEIASEKGTKIMEIIFSSTSAAKYFIGKITGVFLVILTQVVVYLLGGWVGFAFAERAEFTHKFLNENQNLVQAVIHNILNINLIFILLGVILYTILSAFSGALVAKVEDASKAAQPAVLLNMVAFFATFPFQNNADTLVVKVLSYVPFFSTYFMPIRVINQAVSPVEIFISLLILILTILGMIFYISRIYQGLMLQTDDAGFFKRLRKGLAYNRN